MKTLLAILIALMVIGSQVWAGDTHQDGDGGHRVVYVITDASGNPVSGQTVRLSIHRASDDATFDFADSLFQFSGWTTRYATMAYNPLQEVYQYTFSVDTAHPGLVSGDYVAVVSNEGAGYEDLQAEVFSIGTTDNLIRIQR